MNQDTVVISIATSSLELAQVQAVILRRNTFPGCHIVIAVDTPSSPCQFSMFDETLREKIIAGCAEFCDFVLEIPEEIHEVGRKSLLKSSKRDPMDASWRHADTLQFIYKWVLSQGFKYLLFVDGDMVPLSTINTPQDLLNGSPIAAVRQVRESRALRRKVEYPWPNLMLLDLCKTTEVGPLDFSPGRFKGVRVDTGGHLARWISAAEKYGFRPTWISMFASGSWGQNDIPQFFAKGVIDFIEHDARNPGDGRYFSELVAGSFLHYRSSSNWRNEPTEIVQKRIQDFIEAVN
jgi:hypothetical protein